LKKRSGKIIYPIYLDSKVSRSRGRRVPISLAAPNLRLDELINALAALDLKYNVEANSSHPASVYHSKGRVIVEYPGKKNELLKLIAKKVRELRAKRGKGS